MGYECLSKIYWIILPQGDTLEKFFEDFPSVKREITMAFLEQSNYLYDKLPALRHWDTI
jgi:hypothetical protein